MVEHASPGLPGIGRLQPARSASGAAERDGRRLNRLSRWDLSRWDLFRWDLLRWDLLRWDLLRWDLLRWDLLR